MAESATSHAKRLYEELFHNRSYHREVIPNSDASLHMFVKVTFNLLSMMELDEDSQTMMTYSRLDLQWIDDFLSWDTEDYGYTQHITVPQEKVWLPDLVVDNSADPHEQMGYKRLPVRVDWDGEVFWSPSHITHSQCDIDVTYYPFDTQICDIEITTEASIYTDVFLEDGASDYAFVVVSEYSQDGSWKLVDTMSKQFVYEFGEEKWEGKRWKKTKLVYSLLLERRNTFYIVSIIIPVMLLSLTASLVFALPAECGEKMGTGITVVLAFDLYLIIIADFLPDTSLNTSILAVYLTSLLGITAFSVIITAFTLRLHHSVGPVGPGTKTLVRFFRTITCQSSNKYKPQDGTLENTITDQSEPQKPEDQEEITWQTVAATVDWLLYIIFTTLTFVISVACLVGMVVGGSMNKPSLGEYSHADKPGAENSSTSE